MERGFPTYIDSSIQQANFVVEEAPAINVDVMLAYVNDDSIDGNDQSCGGSYGDSLISDATIHGER